MITLEEYTGLLIGGPKDGTLVTSSEPRIPTSEIVELWLDGSGVGKVPTLERTEGTYIWDAEKMYFKWELKGRGYITRD